MRMLNSQIDVCFIELTYFILAACVLHNCEIQFDFTKLLRA